MPEQEKRVKVRHQNNGKCPKCAQIFDKYPGVNSDLRSWFENVQDSHPTAHISCAGRGKADQEAVFAEGKSKARWGQSAHNWNCAIDIFHMKMNHDGSVVALYDRPWYIEIIEPNLEPFLKWYGTPGSSFYELPHVEIADWRNGNARLVE